MIHLIGTVIFSWNRMILIDDPEVSYSEITNKWILEISAIPSGIFLKGKSIGFGMLTHG